MSESVESITKVMEGQIHALQGNDGKLHEEADVLSYPENHANTGQFKMFGVGARGYEIKPVRYADEKRFLKHARIVEHLEISQTTFIIERFAQMFIERFVRPEGMRLAEALIANADSILKDDPGVNLFARVDDGKAFYIDELIDAQVEKAMWVVVSAENKRLGVDMKYEEFVDGIVSQEALHDAYNEQVKFISKAAELGKSTQRRLRPLLMQLQKITGNDPTGNSQNSGLIQLFQGLLEEPGVASLPQQPPTA